MCYCTSCFPFKNMPNQNKSKQIKQKTYQRSLILHKIDFITKNHNLLTRHLNQSPEQNGLKSIHSFIFSFVPSRGWHESKVGNAHLYKAYFRFDYSVGSTVESWRPLFGVFWIWSNGLSRVEARVQKFDKTKEILKKINQIQYLYT